MNILPKKRWHVRTKENIARVKADEAKFLEETQRKQFRANLAEQESRTDFLRKRSALKRDSAPECSLNSDLLSQSDVSLIRGNKEHEEELRKEKEKQEKSIGLLTYLGQSVLDAERKPWYAIHPGKRTETDRQTGDAKIKEEWEAKKKARADPLTAMKRVSEWFTRKRDRKSKEETIRMRQANACISAMPSLFPNDISVPRLTTNQNIVKSTHGGEADTDRTDTKPRKRRKYNDEETSREYSEIGGNTTGSSSLELTGHIPSGSDCSTSAAIDLVKRSSIETLRAERLQRERKERERAAIILAKAAGLPQALPEEEKIPDERTLPFNSAFNPELSALLAERRQKHSRRF